jgi:hypothetical protein
MGSGGIGRIGHYHDLLTPRRASACLEHRPKQGIVGLVGGIVLASDQGAIPGEAIDVPRRHEDDDAAAEDVRLVVAETRLVSHGVLLATFAFEGAVGHGREDAILRWGKVCRAWSTHHHAGVHPDAAHSRRRYCW